MPRIGIRGKQLSFEDQQEIKRLVGLKTPYRKIMSLLSVSPCTIRKYTKISDSPAVTATS